jgi:hypothetical protein
VFDQSHLVYLRLEIELFFTLRRALDKLFYDFDFKENFNIILWRCIRRGHLSCWKRSKDVLYELHRRALSLIKQ